MVHKKPPKAQKRKKKSKAEVTQNPSQTTPVEHPSTAALHSEGVTSDTSPPPKHRCRKLVKGYEYDLTGNVKDCVTRYLELSGKKLSDLKYVATPGINDDQLDSTDYAASGELAKCASKIVLKCLWCARLTRPDIYWTVNLLAKRAHKC